MRQFAKEDLRIWASGSPSDLRARLVTARYVDNVHSAQSTINMVVHKKGKAGPNACYAHKVSILRSAISQTLTRADLEGGSLTDVDLQRRLSTVCILRHMFANEIAAHSLLLCFPHTNWYSFGDKPESEVSSQLFYFHSCHM